jgi:ferrous iron transport protein B
MSNQLKSGNINTNNHINNSKNDSNNKSVQSLQNLRLVLVGNPNCGKTALFNALTGSKQRVANYPGVTVEKKHGYFVTQQQINCTLIDLPGVYSLRARSVDEKVTHDVIFNKYDAEVSIDIIICVLDATNLYNGLRLVLELKQAGKPIIIALNMMDVAKRAGYKYDLVKLAALLGCDVVETIAIKSHGVSNLVSAIDKYIIGGVAHQTPKFLSKLSRVAALDTPTTPEHAPNNSGRDNADTRNYHLQALRIFEMVKLGEGNPSKWSERIDNIVLHPILGIVILLGILFSLFQSVFSLAKIPQDMIQNWVLFLQNYVIALLPNSLLGSLLGDGVIAGVGAVLVFVPQILIISLFIILLEDSGYMSRAAFLMDRVMARVGLHGKAFIPLLSSFACAIPGIMAARTIENRNDRLITILVSPLITCSARLPIYTLLISAFIPVKTVFGVFNLQGLVMFLLYAIGIFFALFMALIFKIFFFKGKRNSSIMELPSYKLPQVKNVIIELIKPLKSFIQRAGTIIVAIMVILWVLATFPIAPNLSVIPAINYSFVSRIGHFLEPLFAPIGFSWQLVAALIPGMMAREVAVSALGTIYALSGDKETVTQSLAVVLQHSWSLASALSLIAWYVFAPQCASTLVVAKRETNSWKWPVIMFVYQIMLAYIAAFIVYNVVSVINI